MTNLIVRSGARKSHTQACLMLEMFRTVLLLPFYVLLIVPD